MFIVIQKYFSEPRRGDMPPSAGFWAAPSGLARMKIWTGYYKHGAPTELTPLRCLWVGQLTMDLMIEQTGCSKPRDRVSVSCRASLARGR